MESILNLIPTVMGMGLIDETLQGLLDAMQQTSPRLGLGTVMVWAKTIGLGIALGVGANECYQMILGRRGLDVMKILHIIIISLCISSAGFIANLAAAPGRALEGIAKDAMTGMAAEVELKEKEVADLQQNYIEEVRKSMRKMEMAREAAKDVKKEEPSWWEFLATPGGTATGQFGAQAGVAIRESADHIENTIKDYTLVTETKICEWISLILRQIGEMLFQMMYYGILVSQRIFMHILAAFAPLMFAISLSPHYKSAWSQWLSKYVSLSLWGFVTYVCVYYIYFILIYNLEQDIAAYTALSGNITEGSYNIAAIGMQALGSTCMYLVGLLMGVKVLAFVPDVASWLMPGGVSSGAGSAASSTVLGAASMAGNATVGAASGVGNAIQKTIR